MTVKIVDGEDWPWKSASVKIDDGEDCDKYIAQKILDLINRQQAEIEAQCKAVKYYQSKATEIKAEAIKEFAERLITEQSFYDGQETRIYLTEKDLDNLVKEMVGDTE